MQYTSVIEKDITATGRKFVRLAIPPNMSLPFATVYEDGEIRIESAGSYMPEELHELLEVRSDFELVWGTVEAFKHWQPEFYWTGRQRDSVLINEPHIREEGEAEDRIADTQRILSDIQDIDIFTLADAINIQNEFLKTNNWRRIVPGLRTHNVTLPGTPHHSKVKNLVDALFPVAHTDKASLLEWYKRVQMVHPLSDLNGRVFGTIVASLYARGLREGVDVHSELPPETNAKVLWIAQEGTQIEEGEKVAELETDKAIYELTAPMSGIIINTVILGQVINGGTAVCKIK